MHRPAKPRRLTITPRRIIGIKPVGAPFIGARVPASIRPGGLAHLIHQLDSQPTTMLYSLKRSPHNIKKTEK
jgi:hypothetical protein